MNGGMAAAGCAALLLLAVGCATVPKARPAVPAALEPPGTATPFLELRGSGVQIYECTAKPEASGELAWTLRAPEATLTDASGQVIGQHYAGPTWQARDGSLVVGEAMARDAGPDPTAIPWLLLRARSASGAGIFAKVQSIQRVRTTGGLAPTRPCTAAQAGEVARSPYAASYYFYRGP